MKTEKEIRKMLEDLEEEYRRTAIGKAYIDDYGQFCVDKDPRIELLKKILEV